MSNENVQTYGGAIKARGAIKGNVNAGTVIKIPGLDGATYTPYLDDLGNLSWTNDGNLPNPDPMNIRGPQGLQGIPGVNGKDGKNGIDGVDGKDYILTEPDKAEIAEMASKLVDIPTDDHINDLINAALGVIANDTY